MNSDIEGKKTLSANDLAHFTGTEQWYRHSINRAVLYTEGAQYVAEHGQAYWLLDEIALIQPYDANVSAEEFQVWKLAVRPDKTATLTCDDGNGHVVFSKEIPYTDFPLETITLYFANDVIHLPSEY
jgi:hypothetical protein